MCGDLLARAMASSSIPDLRFTLVWPPSAVTSFSRYSRLMEALGRRLCGVLLSMYFDDATIQDWAQMAAQGRQPWPLLTS